MGNLLNAVERKRQKLIELLIMFNEYDREENPLTKLTLTELEQEYKRFQHNNHPHGDFGSIKFKSNLRNQE
ncbi:Fur-regulated basic protein FbpA [Peribacillus sp. SCS-155]|uniref:Fur-regulated basic protein FbpA n=1 Tax=Peribacillus sedimenti TaxID=3115297 RepID=UPI003906C507